MAIQLREVLNQSPLEVQLPESASLADIQALVLQWFPDHRVEITPDKHLVFMSPTGSTINRLVFRAAEVLSEWNRSSGEPGCVFAVDLGFVQTNGSVMCPDVAWVSQPLYQSLSSEVKESWMLPVAPEFVIEMQSRSNSLSQQQSRMEVYLASGTRLGWLIDPTREQAYIYRPGQAPEQVSGFDAALSGEGVLPGFTLPLSELRLRP